MNSVTVDGYTINGDPLIVSALADFATHLITRMMEEGKERATLPFVANSEEGRAAIKILLKRDSTIVLKVDDDGSDDAAEIVNSIDAEWIAAVEELKALAAQSDDN